MRLTSLLALAPLVVLGCSGDADQPTGGHGGSGGSGGAGGGAPLGPIAGAVKRYDYAFDVSTAHAVAAIEIDVGEPGGDCFAVSCNQSAMGVTWNDETATSAVVEGGALAACGAGVAAGEPLAITAEIDVPEKTFYGLDVGFSRVPDKDGGEFTYLLSWVGGCDQFGPCDDDPARLAQFHFDVTHPKGTVVLCPGKLTAGETLTQCDLDDTLAPTYSGFGIAADPLWQRADFVTAAGANLVFYETPTGNLAASLDEASVGEFMEWITDLLGPLPYGSELRFAGAPTAWLGFEHPANVILSEDLPALTEPYADNTMHVFMHEIVHQWAGDRTTLAAVQDFVWKEATAEYLSYVFEDEHRPAGEAAASLAYWDAISLQSKHYPRPNDDPPPEVQKFYGDVYGPGPMVLYVQLEAMIGRAAVLAGIEAFLAEPGAKSVHDLRAALEASSGESLVAYFDAWVFGTGEPEWPTFAISTMQSGDQVTVTLTQENDSRKLYGCLVEVEVNGASRSALAKIDFGLAPTSPSASAIVTLAEPVAGTVLDPNHRVVGRLAGAGAAPEKVLKVYPL